MKFPLVSACIGLGAVITSAAVSVYRNLQPIPPPVYKEFGGTWKMVGAVSTGPDDLTVCEVARRETERLGRVVTIQEVENAIIMGRMVPPPQHIEVNRSTFRISPSYLIKW